MNFRKNIVLKSANTNYSLQKGVLTIDAVNGSINATLRIYNLQKFDGEYIVGIMVDKLPIIKHNLQSDVCFKKFPLNCVINNNSEVLCIVVRMENLKAEPIVWGSTNSTSSIDMCLNKFESIDEIIDNEIKKQGLEEFTSVKENTRPYSKNNVDENKCKACEYKQFFYNHSCKAMGKEINEANCNTQNCSSNEDLNNTSCLGSNVSEKTFFSFIQNYIKAMCQTHNEMVELNELIPNSQWYRIPVNDNDFYCIGIIYEDGKERYIGYAVTGNYAPEPPSELSADAQWLPINAMYPKDAGFWVMFQDAITGE